MLGFVVGELFFLLRDSVYSCDRDYRKRLRIGINFLMLVD